MKLVVPRNPRAVALIALAGVALAVLSVWFGPGRIGAARRSEAEALSLEAQKLRQQSAHPEIYTAAQLEDEILKLKEDTARNGQKSFTRVELESRLDALARQKGRPSPE